MSERSPQDAALAYAGAGWPVFPCRPGSKEPATRNGFHDASTDERQIREWWHREPDRNVAIATGAPGPDVVDVDVREDGSGFPAFNRARRAGLAGGHHAIVRTPSTGMHLYFAGTDQRSGSLHGQHLDFRSQGGYVVAPPSRPAAPGTSWSGTSPRQAAPSAGTPSGAFSARSPSPAAIVPRGATPSVTQGGQTSAGSLTGSQPGSPVTAISRCSTRPSRRPWRASWTAPPWRDSWRPPAGRACAAGSAEARRTIESGRRAAEREAREPPRPFQREPREGGGLR